MATRGRTKVSHSARAVGEAKGVTGMDRPRQSVPRVDMPALATGQFEFVHNVRVDGMVHGRVVRPPDSRRDDRQRRRTVGRRPARRRQGGCQKQLRRHRLREAVAGDPGGESTEGGVDSWHGPPSRGAFYDHLRPATRRGTRWWSIQAMWTRRSRRSARRSKATYRHPYQMHGSVGSSCAVADVAERSRDDLVGHAVGAIRCEAPPR